MRRFLRGAGLVGAGAGAFLLAAPPAGAQPADGPPVAPVADRVARSVTEMLAELNTLQLAPGFSAAVVRGDSVVVTAEFGVADVEAGTPVTADTRFPVQEIGGGFLAVAAACLHVRGELDLDAPVTDYLPDLRLLPPLNPAEITLRDLLGSTHSLAGWGVPRALLDLGVTDPDTLLAAIARTVTESSRSPDSWTRLSDLGFLVATLALDRATGLPWPDLLEREVFGPLGMTATTAKRGTVPAGNLATVYINDTADFASGPREPVRYVVCDASVQPLDGIVSTAADLARWSIAALNDGRLHGHAGLPPGAFAEVHALGAPRPGGGDDYRIDGTGLGHVLARVDGRSVIHYAPGTFRSTLYPEEGTAVVLLANSLGSGSRMLEFAATALAASHLAGDPAADANVRTALAQLRTRAEVRRRAESRAPLPDLREESPAPPLGAFVGAYQHPELGVLLVSRVGSSLRASLGCRSGTVTRSAGRPPVPGEPLTAEGLGALEFTFSGDGVATVVTWRNKAFRRADS